MKNVHKRFGFIAMAAILGLTFTLSLAGCNKSIGSGKGLPSPLSNNASKSQAVAAVNQIAAYCEAQAKAENDPEYATAYSAAGSTVKLLSLVSVISDSDWREKQGPSTVGTINKVIDSIEKMEAKRKEGK